MFLESCPFLPGCQICWHIIVHMVFCSSVVSVEISFFQFLIFFIWVHSLFFLVNLVRGLSILFTLSKNQLLVLLIFSSF